MWRGPAAPDPVVPTAAAAGAPPAREQLEARPQLGLRHGAVPLPGHEGILRRGPNAGTPYNTPPILVSPIDFSATPLQPVTPEGRSFTFGSQDADDFASMAVDLPQATIATLYRIMGKPGAWGRIIEQFSSPDALYRILQERGEDLSVSALPVEWWPQLDFAVPTPLLFTPRHPP